MANLLPGDFKEFLSLLNAHQVEYLLVGGYAVTFHGYPRATNDIDFWGAVSQPPMRIELTTTISGARFDDGYARRVIAVLDGVQVTIIGQEDLKANKKAAGRSKDLADLENLP